MKTFGKTRTHRYVIDGESVKRREKEEIARER